MGQGSFLLPRGAFKCPIRVGQPSPCGLRCRTSKASLGLGRAQEPQVPVCPLSAYICAPWGLSTPIK